jgi:hypothetical protein
MNESEIILEYQSLKNFTDEVGLRLELFSAKSISYIVVWRGESRIAEVPNLAGLRLFLAGYSARGEE